MTKPIKPLMLVLSSPSGAGKTTLSKKIQQSDNSFEISVSHTTRNPRPNEVDGVDYHFVTKENFQKLLDQGLFYEHAEIFGNFYGTSKSSIKKITNNNHNVLFDIDWQGADKIKKKKLNFKLLTFFILPPSKKVLKERLLNRHKNDSKIVAERMKQFEKDVKRWKNYEFIVVNDNLSKCYKEIVLKIRLKLSQKKIISDKIKIKKHIKKLI